MLTEFNSLPELLEHFKDQETCLRYWEEVRWNGNIKCPHCGHDKVYRTNRGFKCCSDKCEKKFSVLVGSIFENTKLPLRIWFGAIFLFITGKKGISAMQLSRQFNIGLKAAWFLNHRVRSAFSQEGQEKLEGITAVDETFVGGRNKNRHKDKKVKYGPRYKRHRREFPDKDVVMGLLNDNQVRLFVVDDVSYWSLRRVIRQNIKMGSMIVSDDHVSYQTLWKRYEHEIVKHSRGKYVNAQGFTTNGIENIWGTFKRGIIGIYNHVSKKHLQLYCNEFAFRFNVRLLTVAERFLQALKKCSQTRLKYAVLTG